MSPGSAPAAYTNPVYGKDFPDPFVLRFNGHYYAYGTGAASDGRFFRMLSSRDLVHWEERGGALEPLDLPGAEAYWAPEVACSEGRFFMYYATGREADPDHHLRVAAAEHPLGPWRDCGVNLTPHEIFAIDPHPFRDPRDGQWSLFYARDDLLPPYAGTGLAVDRLLSMDRLEGAPRNVLRPYADWQLFELKRPVKHGLDWYTVEGPFVVPAESGYCCFFSGGRWENPNYGVGYALAETPQGPWTDDANAAGPQVLTTVPGKVIGPGHNSVVVGPDLLTSYIVYHGWDPALTARLLRIDPLTWREGRPHCDGPSSDSRPTPALPDYGAWFDEAAPGPEWEHGSGEWEREGADLFTGGGAARLRLQEPQGDLVAEAGVRLRSREGAAGIAVGEVEVALTSTALLVGEASVPVPPGFRPDTWHRLSVRRERGIITATLDEYPTLQAPCQEGAARVALFGRDAGFAHFALTRLARG
jgi:GH43 family beta-xylosidase